MANPARGLAIPRRSPAISAKYHDFIEFPFVVKGNIFAETEPLYAKGFSLREIELRTGIPKTVVRRELIRGGVSLRPTRMELKAEGWRKVGKSNVKPPYGFSYLEGRVVRNPKEYPVLHFRPARQYQAISLRLQLLFHFLGNRIVIGGPQSYRLINLSHIFRPLIKFGGAAVVLIRKGAPPVSSEIGDRSQGPRHLLLQLRDSACRDIGRPFGGIRKVCQGPYFCRSGKAF